jgi:hypothetical protein
MNAADQAWLAARATVCAKAYHTGGTIDQVNIASCLADETLARFYVVKNIEAPTAVLKVTDSQNPSDMSWYSTPDGSRIGLVDTQGDATGGVIIAWTVIAGANGFVVNPLQYYYRNGYFKDAGIMEQPDQAGHVMAPGTEYAFSIDYSTLAHDPYRALSPGQFMYVPAGEVAVWWAPRLFRGRGERGPAHRAQQAGHRLGRQFRGAVRGRVEQAERGVHGGTQAGLRRARRQLAQHGDPLLHVQPLQAADLPAGRLRHVGELPVLHADQVRLAQREAHVPAQQRVERRGRVRGAGRAAAALVEQPLADVQQHLREHGLLAGEVPVDPRS